MSATRKIARKQTLQARLAECKKGRRRPITQEQRNSFALEGNYICGYLRRHFLREGLPRGACALRQFMPCTDPQFMSEGPNYNCPTYRKFLEYRAEKGEEPTDLEELREYMKR